jgi:acyl-CoA thioesterase YciA
MTIPEAPKGQLVICIAAMPADTNANGDIFGGWLVSHMDMGGGVAARREAHCRVVTVAIDRMVFIKPVRVGDNVACYAELLTIGRSSMQFQIEAWSLSFDDKNHKKVAEGIFTFVAINEQGKPQPVKR